MVSTRKNRNESNLGTSRVDECFRGHTRADRDPPTKFLQPFLTAGWVSARQSSISKMSSGLSPRWPQRRDMRTEWCRSSCKVEGCWEGGLLSLLLSASQGISLFPTCSPLPVSRGLSYCSIERSLLRSPLLQLLLDCCGKNGDSGGDT